MIKGNMRRLRGDSTLELGRELCEYLLQIIHAKLMLGIVGVEEVNTGLTELTDGWCRLRVSVIVHAVRADTRWRGL